MQFLLIVLAVVLFAVAGVLALVSRGATESPGWLSNMLIAFGLAAFAGASAVALNT